MNSVREHHSSGRRRSRDSTYQGHSTNQRRGSSSSKKSRNRYKDRPRRRYSDERHIYQNNQVGERSPSTRRDKSSHSRQPETNNRDICVSGPDLFASVLGPTPDETFLVGLQTFLGFCTGHTEEVFNNHQEIKDDHHSEEEQSVVLPNEHSGVTQNESSVVIPREPSIDRTDTVTESTEPKSAEQSYLEPLEGETEIENTTESQFLGHSPTLEQTAGKSEESHTTEFNQSKHFTVSTESQTENFELRHSCHCKHQHTSDKFSETTDLTISTGDMNSEHSSQTEYPSIESRTAQTSDKRGKKSCICKIMAGDTASESTVPHNQCNCSGCCNKRRSKPSRRCKPTHSKTKSKCLCNAASVPVTNTRKGCYCSSTDLSYSTEDDDKNVVVKNGQMGLVKYAITKITKFCSYTTFEIMKSTKKKPKVMPSAVEGVFVLKNSKES